MLDFMVTSKPYRCLDTDIVVQLVLSLKRLVKRRGTKVRDRDAAACVQLHQENQASSPVVQRVREQLPLIDRDLGQVDFTPAHTEHTHTQSHLSIKTTCFYICHNLHKVEYIPLNMSTVIFPCICMSCTLALLTLPYTPQSSVLPWTRAPPPLYLDCP